MIPIKKVIVNTFYAVALVFLLFFQIVPAQAEEGKIIKIKVIKDESYTALKLDPAELTVEKDVIVIWLNSIVGQEVNILFQNNNLPQTAVTDAMGFSMEKDNVYAAKYLPFIATASLRFIKEGTYAYTVELKNSGCAATGTILVRTPPGS